MNEKMKGLILLLIPVMAFGLLSCGKTSNQIERVLKPVIPAVEKTDSCKINPMNVYEVFIPERSDSAEKLPLVVIIDAHGDGKFALNKFRLGAGTYSVVLVASDYVKNGFENFTGAIQNLVEDVRQKYPVNKTIFLAGFSGGARMALGYAQTQPVNGLILCGALANVAQITAVRCPVFSISGTDDFNFVETAQYLFQEQLIPENLKIELTGASHNWPDSLVLANAVGFLRLSSLAEEPKEDYPKTNVFCENQKARIDSLKKQGDFLKAALVARNLSVTVPFNNDKSFATSYNEIKSKKEYINQFNNLQKWLKIEVNIRQPYLEAFSTKDSLWWKKEIRSINEQIETEKDPFAKDMYKRIKSFWGIACYSLGNQAIKEKNAVSLNKIVTVYRMLEPENAYGIYFSAFPFYWKGDTKTTIAILKNAREAGFTDLNQLKTDFPESVSSKVL